MSLVKHWRLVLLSLFAIVALAAFAACGDDDDDEGDDGETPAATTPGGAPSGDERIDGGELTIQGNEFQSLDPHFSSFAQDISLHRMLWRGLYSLDMDNVPVPAMAASDPEVSADGMTYTITLRDGLVWSDGDDLLAEDFVAGLLRTCNPVNAGEYQYVLTEVVGCDDFYNAAAGPDHEAGTADDLALDDASLQPLQDAVGVTAIDDTTIEIKLSVPKPTFPIILSLWMTFPVPVHLPRFAAATPSAPGDWGTDPAALAYNGPYVMDSYTPQLEGVLSPNPNWSEEYSAVGKAPTLDKITVRYIDDLSQAANAYRSGELDATDVDLTQLETLVSEFGDGEEYFKFLAPSTRGVEMNLEHPPLDNLDVRLALSRAIDRDALNQVVVQGGNEPSTSWVPEVTGGHAPDEFNDIVGFDAAAAAQHLADAGYPDGAGFPTLDILVGDSPSAQATAQFLQESFRTILNIETTITVVDSPTRSSRFREEQFDLFPGGWIQDYPDPENWIVGLFDTPGTLNHYNCSDPEIDALVEEAKVNTNDTERRQQYKDANEIISTTMCGIATYWHENNHWLRKSNVIGISEYMTGQDGAMGGDWAAEAWGLSS
ncbi:MAG TPA: peptide ABC transporter substrate-binding protein [Dehalococcoidia bacterium]|nr:peptide ABC transporter substrate-binding protein [Dehalococcoidia bacterium]